MTTSLPSLHVAQADILDAAQLTKQIEIIRSELCIHLAWYVEPGKYLASPANLDFLCASLRLAKNLAERGCKRFVASGSCLEYDSSDKPLNESSPTRPRHLYSAVKLALYHALDDFCRTADMQFAWTRFFYQYGPGEDPRRLVPTTINSLLRGQVCNLTPGDQVRDFLHVADVASAVVAVAQSHLTGAVNIGSGVPLTIREIAETIAALLGRPDLIALGAEPYHPATRCTLSQTTRGFDRMRTGNRSAIWKPDCAKPSSGGNPSGRSVAKSNRPTICRSDGASTVVWVLESSSVPVRGLSSHRTIQGFFELTIRKIFRMLRVKVTS